MTRDVPIHSWVPRLLALVAVALVPWTLWLTISLPSRHVTAHYDVAWIGFDIALAAAFAGTAWSAFRRPRWLVALATATGTMLLCDAWFDIITSSGGGERLEAVAEAAFAELPLAAICAYIVLEPGRFGARIWQAHPSRPTGRRAALRAHPDAAGAERSED